MPNEAALPERVKHALESGDMDALKDLLDPDARWGAPEGPQASDCRNRDQILAWWGRAQAAGARATVTEVITGPGTLLVGLQAVRPAVPGECPETGQRWQVLTVRDDRITDIRGYEDRETTARRAGLPA